MTRGMSKSRRAAHALVILACLAPPGPLGAQSATLVNEKLDAVVREALQAGRSVRAIVRFHSDADRARGAAVVTTRRGRIRRSHDDVTALTIEGDAATINALAYDAGVAAISVDASVRASIGDSHGGRANGASKVRDRFNKRGTGVSVAIIDSGIEPHIDLPSSRIRAFVDFVNGRTTPYDDFGHGTHVAGIVAGSGAASVLQPEPFAGVAPDADIVALKVLDSKGAG